MASYLLALLREVGVPTTSVVEQAREILRYFVQHPMISDDLEGIARWRLVQEQIYRHVDDVRRALDLLIGLDLVQQEQSATSGTRYSLNAGKLRESKKFVLLRDEEQHHD